MIDWQILDDVGLNEEVHGLLDEQACFQLFDIINTTYKELTLDFLASFDLKRRLIDFHRDDTIQFQAFGNIHKMSLTKFAIHFGLYDEAFTQTPEYNTLLIERPADEPMETCWSRLSTSGDYDPRRTKATSLRSPSLRYIHYLLSHILTGKRDSTGVVSRKDFDYLLSVVNGFRLHLGYQIAIAMHHQATDPRVAFIFAGHYITQLIQGMGLGSWVSGTQYPDHPRHAPSYEVG